MLRGVLERYKQNLCTSCTNDKEFQVRVIGVRMPVTAYCWEFYPDLLGEDEDTFYEDTGGRWESTFGLPFIPRDLTDPWPAALEQWKKNKEQTPLTVEEGETTEEEESDSRSGRKKKKPRINVE